MKPAVTSETAYQPSLSALTAARAAESHRGLTLCVAPNEQVAYRLEAELRFFLPDELPLVHLPDTEVLPYDQFSPHQEILSERLAALWRLPRTERGMVLVTADALMQKLPPRSWLEGRSFLLKAGDKLNPLTFRERLIAAGYASASEVQTQGEFAVRGALLDLYPMGSDTAYRIDLFDDEVESIRSFDPETQRSQDKVSHIRLLPAREFPTDKEGIETFRRQYREYFPGDASRSRIYREVSKGLMPGGIEAWLPLFFPQTARLADYLPPNTQVVSVGDISAALTEDWKQIEERYERYSGDIERPLVRPADLFYAPETAIASLPTPQPLSSTATVLSNGAEHMKVYLKESADRILFIAESPGRREALLNWLKPLGIEARQYDNWQDYLTSSKKYGVALGTLQEGFRLSAEQLSIVCESQLFGRIAPTHSPSRKRARVRDPETILRDLGTLTIGSPVVHAQHGVGRYCGLERMEAGGMEAEYLVLEYAKGDKIYVPVGSLALIHRYTGAEDQSAPLHTLGTDRWSKAQKKAQEKAHDAAAELLQIQARRMAKPGLKLEIDWSEYEQFIAAFPFTPTPDQQKAIEAVLGDLQAEKTTDRVVCGDVGFGKTEVALRAAFCVARGQRQVCMLAPTTLLAEQHAKNFADRFAGWNIKLAAMSRMRTAKEQTQILKDLESGAVDVVIGTHRLLQEDIRFQNLGLVIVDEEHRFGVRHKERLKNLRAEVDLLTLTATPIPRTLNMSLTGLRDLSIIATPPPSRIAIKTTVVEWSNALVQEAIERELRRGGQVYLLHNEVSDIAEFSRKIQELVPDARVRYAHGQLRERELEQVMLDFYHQRFNVLVCTTIIESGIDVPTANTILIDRADQLGLAQLHQLRGRVGRSHHRAFAYLLVPSRQAITADAQKRLDAIETLGDLGSGFALATHDLEIRGAGELLGEEQTGQIEEIGFTMYAELLARAVRAIKSGKLDDKPFGSSACEVDLGVSALITEDYIPDVHARLTLYKRIAEAEDEAMLDELRVEMVDRFGLLPPQTERLFEAASVRVMAQGLGITKLRAGQKTAALDFGSEVKIEPIKLIKLIQSQPRVYKLEGQKRLHITANLEDAVMRVTQMKKLLELLGAPATLAA